MKKNKQLEGLAGKLVVKLQIILWQKAYGIDKEGSKNPKCVTSFSNDPLVQSPLNLTIWIKSKVALGM